MCNRIKMKISFVKLLLLELHLQVCANITNILRSVVKESEFSKSMVTLVQKTFQRNLSFSFMYVVTTVRHCVISEAL